LPRALTAAGVLAVLGVGGMLAVGGNAGETKSQAETETVTSSTASGPPPATATAPTKPADGNTDGVGSIETAPKPEEATGEAAFYQVQSTTSMDTCEVALGKSASDFGSVKKWRATQAWKLARKSLMAGREDEALKQMCEASFIDASSPATIGLAKYYLGRRGLEQAHSWASKAVDVALGANSKRTAQQVLGDVLSQMGKVDEARSVWLVSFNLTADQPARLAPVVRNFINAAVKARKGGDPALAEQLLRRATTFEPDNVNAAALLSATLLENGEKKLAKAWAERALQKKPGLDMAEDVLKSLGG
jgi:Tfp pilus assembly protein PilF